MLSCLLTDIRLACRSMRRQPTFTAVVVGTLALGIGANTAMFGLVHAALLAPLPYEEPGRLVLARRTVAGRPLLLHSGPDYYDYEEQTPGFESLAGTRGASNQATIAGRGGGPEHVTSLQVSYNLFPTLGVKPVAGRWFTKDEDRAGAAPAVMIGEGLAKRRFGGAAQAVGQNLVLAGGGPAALPAIVVGVMPASYSFIAPADLYVLMRRGEEDGPATRGFHNWALVARLKPGVSIDQVQRQVDVISKRLQQEYPKTNKNKAMRLEPLQGALLGSQTPMLLILTGAVGLVLLIACANVAGLLVARGVARRSELAVRAALGASRGRIMVQLVTESVVLAALSGLAGVALSIWLRRVLPFAAGLAESGAEVGRGAEAPVLLFALAVSLVTGVLSGIAPAVRASSLRLAANLAPGARATEARGGSRLRSLLVVGQVALSLVLLVGAGLLLRSIDRLASTDLGFKSDGLYVATLDQPYRDEARRIQFQDGLLDELAAMPGAEAVAFTSQVPIRHPGSDPPAWPTKRPPADSSQQLTALRRIVTPGYFKTLGIPVLAGRDLSAADRVGAPLVTVVDEATARQFFPGENPIGQRLMVSAMPGKDPGPKEFEIVGIVGSARLNSVGRAPVATVYMSSHQFGMGRVNVMLRSSVSGGGLTRTISRLIAERHADIAVDPLVPMDAIVDAALLSPRLMAVTLGAFSSVALLLAALGLYGVLAFYVKQRGHELGVRMALGAGTGVILRQVLSRSAVMVGPGLVIGLLASLAGGRLMRQFLYEVEPTDAATYVGVSLGLAAVAFAASAWPALRAARVNPVEALRGE